MAAEQPHAARAPPSPSRSRRARASPPASPPPTAPTPSPVAIDPTKGARRHRHARPRLPAGRARRRRAGPRRPHRGRGRHLARWPASTPAGVICEIMNDDGTMARLPDLVAFAQLHGLKIGTIADLIAYRRRDRVDRRARLRDHARQRLRRRRSADRLRQHGDDGAARRAGEGRSRRRAARCWCACTRVNLLTDVLGQRSGGRGGELEAAMREIAEEGRGVVVLIREPLTIMLSEQRTPRRRGERSRPGELRDYGVGAQILLDLGVRRWCCCPTARRRRRPRRLRPHDRGQQPVPGESKRSSDVDADGNTDGSRPARRRRQRRAHPDRRGPLLRRHRRRAGRPAPSASSPRTAAIVRARRRARRVRDSRRHRAGGAGARTTATSRWAASSAARPPITTMSAARARAA